MHKHDGNCIRELSYKMLKELLSLTASLEIYGFVWFSNGSKLIMCLDEQIFNGLFYLKNKIGKLSFFFLRGIGKLSCI